MIDSGDRVEGNGLYDASDPKGKYTFDILKHQHIDVLCSGNHELYKQNTSENEFNKTVPDFKGHYLASNIDIADPETGHVVPLAQRFRKFKTPKLGLTITAFGFIFNFGGNAKNTVVRHVQDTIQEKWFKDAIRDKETDLFIVNGHVGADMEEFRLIFKAIREVRWDTPIQFFAGHTHIRDFRVYDKLSTAMESGRYMETIGFLSIDGITAGKRSSNLKFNRRYIDNNLFSLHHHSKTNASTFPTELGLNVSTQIAHARTKMNLDHRYGCAPTDLWMNRVGIDNDRSIYNWLSEQVLPDSFTSKRSNASRPLLALSNTGAIRFDIFKGPFTVDSAYLVSPFTSAFRQIKDVDYKVASKLLGVINNNGQYFETADGTFDTKRLVVPEQRVSPRSVRHSTAQMSIQNHDQVVMSGDEASDEPVPFPGYITKDDAGQDGDDTVHSPLPYVRTPNCVQSEIDFPSDGSNPQSVDIVYNEFVQPWVLLALGFLGAKYEAKDTQLFMHGESMTDVIRDWAKEHWPCE